VAALHLAVSRSAAVRLAPVVSALSALGARQALLDLSGRAAAAADGMPRTTVARDAWLSAAGAAAAAEAAIERLSPAVVLVAGDGHAAVAAALAAARHGIPIARLGAGLRCGDRTVEAETNRIVLDELADRLYADGEGAAERLRAEGAPEDRIRCVGSTLPDAVARWLGPATERAAWDELGLGHRGYVLVTLHKSENVGDDERVARITEALRALARRCATLVCLHPRARDMMEPMGDLERLRSAGAIVTGSLDYVDFLSLQAHAGAVLTDSAGVQEETTVLGVPCFTLAHSSERTLTLTHGTNVLLGDDPADIADVAMSSLVGGIEPIPLWDGRAGQRIAADLQAGPRWDA
jgi:UDP-N-acetylglucosamine 2-epimerase (non-hydrolysing)